MANMEKELRAAADHVAKARGELVEARLFLARLWPQPKELEKIGEIMAQLDKIYRDINV